MMPHHWRIRCTLNCIIHLNQWIKLTKCKISGTCPLPDIVEWDSPWIFEGDIITVQDGNCPRGYISVLESAVTCEKNSQWSGSIGCKKGITVHFLLKRSQTHNYLMCLFSSSFVYLTLNDSDKKPLFRV